MHLPFLPNCRTVDPDGSQGRDSSGAIVIVESRSERGVTIERADLLCRTRTGAVIGLTTPRPLPGRISVYFPDDGVERPARVQWRDDFRFGIELGGSGAAGNNRTGNCRNSGRFVVIEGGSGPECRIDF